MQAEALEVIKEIVAAGDAGKKLVHFRGALFAGGIKIITHPLILAFAHNEGKA